MMSAVFVFHDLIKGDIKQESKRRLKEQKDKEKGKNVSDRFIREYLFDSGL